MMLRMNQHGNFPLVTPPSSLPPMTATARKGAPELQIAPQEIDYICGRGKVAYQHPGNRMVRKIVQRFLEPYSNATTKIDKSRVVSDIITTVRHYGGNFVKLNNKNGTYEAVSERIVREKVGQSFRDALHTGYKSSTAAKRRKRDDRKAQYNDHIYRILNENKAICTIIAAVSEQVNDDKSDDEFMQLFQYANMQILQELKDRKCATDLHFRIICDDADIIEKEY